MARLKLQTKTEDVEIKGHNKKGITIKRKQGDNSTYIPGNDPDNFTLLMDNRCEEEKFSRICKFFVNHYYKIGTEWLCEKIFYPSAYGFNEIQKEKKHPYVKLCNQLRDKGIGLWGERPKPTIYNKQKRLQLKCKPKRMTLSCKEED